MTDACGDRADACTGAAIEKKNVSLPLSIAWLVSNITSSIHLKERGQMASPDRMNQTVTLTVGLVCLSGGIDLYLEHIPVLIQ